MPFQMRTVLGVATAWWSGGFKGVDSSMGEGRLEHVEASFEVPTWLARALLQCERALLCGTGPKNKAAKLSLQDLVSDAESLRGDFLSVLHWLFHKYVVADRCWFRGVEGTGRGLRTPPSRKMFGSPLVPPWRPRRRLTAKVSYRSCCPAGFGRSALASDGRQLGAVEERVGSKMAVVGVSRRCRGKPLGSEAMRPRRLAHYGDPARGLVGVYTSSGVRGGLRGGAEEVPGSRRWCSRPPSPRS